MVKIRTFVLLFLFCSVLNASKLETLKDPMEDFSTQVEDAITFAESNDETDFSFAPTERVKVVDEYDEEVVCSEDPRDSKNSISAREIHLDENGNQNECLVNEGCQTDLSLPPNKRLRMKKFEKVDYVLEDCKSKLDLLCENPFNLKLDNENEKDSEIIGQSNNDSAEPGTETETTDVTKITPSRHILDKVELLYQTSKHVAICVHHIQKYVHIDEKLLNIENFIHDQLSKLSAIGSEEFQLFLATYYYNEIDYKLDFGQLKLLSKSEFNENLKLAVSEKKDSFIKKMKPSHQQIVLSKFQEIYTEVSTAVNDFEFLNNFIELYNNVTKEFTQSYYAMRKLLDDVFKGDDSSVVLRKLKNAQRLDETTLEILQEKFSDFDYLRKRIFKIAHT
ncbi:hypothetical protein ROZALSC1DRAFT_30451 [Rozella allomycis CSF55]|uniref:Uncharacterized protein n=1 Tax=Rozella allomycis (strain CSF55) TaxID=988480 RepID=A0A4V1IZE5_ROZAC|nr:hypothetical protein ROZALSC1DRAFT_30451 [Rozella allomycis CSF55]